MGKVLIIDDERQLRGLLARIIGLEGYEVIQAENCAAGLRQLERTRPEVVLCDVKLPDGNGVDLVGRIKAIAPDAEVILLTAYGNIPDGVQAIKNGAFDYITKGDDNPKIIPLLSRAMEKAKAQRKSAAGRQPETAPSFEAVIGSSKAMRDAVELARKVAATDTSVLLTGETGTGKEVFAQAIHREGGRSGKAFVAVNCSAFAKDLLESELFGHRAGAFTGAAKDKKGLFEEADGGTIFLDEIGEIPTSVQAKLLRVLEEKIVMRIGQERYIPINVRIVCATNKDLAELVRCGKFREDLFYRLNVLRLNLPPLRKHPEDIEELVDSFLSWLPQSLSLPRPLISPEALAVLKRYHFPGNIRELRNVIERLVVIAKGREIRESDISRVLLMNEAPCGNSHKKTETVPPSPSTPAGANRRTKQSMLRAQINSTILQVLEETQGNKAETARRLGISPATLWRRLKEIAAQEKK